MGRHFKKHTHANKFKKQSSKIVDFIVYALIFGPVCFFFLLFIGDPIDNYLWKHYGKYEQGVIISESNLNYSYSYKGNGAPDDGYYKYEFMHDGKSYTGNSGIPASGDIVHDRHIGQRIDVVYLDFWPRINHPKSWLDR